MADSHGVVEKTVRNWILMSQKEDVPALGHPPHSPEKRRQALWAVARLLRDFLGKLTHRQAYEALPEVPDRLINEFLPRLKARRKARHRRKIASLRVSTDIQATGVVMAQDGTHLGRTKDEKVVEAQVAIDGATCEVKGIEIGLTASEEDILRFWQGLSEKDRPLVWQTDNALAYLSERIQAFLKKIGVIHLVSRPAKPTDNPRAERFMRSFKEVSGLGKGVIIQNLAFAALHAARCADWMSCSLKMVSRSMKTASELAQDLKPWYHFVDRWTFYSETRNRLDALPTNPCSLSERRQMERSIIMDQLVRYGLANVNRGGAYCAL